VASPLVSLVPIDGVDCPPLPTAFGHCLKKPPPIITMSIQAPQGILNIPNATLRVGKLAVDEVVGADTILNTVARNTILLVDDEAYHENKNWSLKLPNAWAGEFECNTASAGNYSEFNFYNEGASSNVQGYNLTFNDTAVELRYDGTLLKTGTLASTITGTGVKKVRLMFERTILSVTVDGTLVFTHDDTVVLDPVYTARPPVASSTFLPMVGLSRTLRL
jgi:hypothetical protein